LLIPAPGLSERQMAKAAWASSLADETPEGKSIVDLADGRNICMGAADAMLRTFPQGGGAGMDPIKWRIGTSGGTSLVVSGNGRTTHGCSRRAA
jgi:K+-transporting ATPase ATPase B chain